MSRVETGAPTRVGIAIVESNGEYLVGVREADKPLAGYHEFPGGKAELDEQPEAAAVRECLEETGLPVVAESLLFMCRHSYPHGQVELFFYRCRPLETPRTLPDRFHWYSAASLQELQFPEANQPVVELLISGERRSVDRAV